MEKSKFYNKNDTLILFNKQIKIFFGQLIELFVDEKDVNTRTICADLIIINLFVSQLPQTSVINLFIEKLIPLRHFVIEKNDSFFLDDGHGLFEKLNSNKVNFFKEIWIQLDEQNKGIIWDWFGTFLKLCDRYINSKDN